MTLFDLYQLRDLRREINSDAERLAELETRATHITQSLSDMPRGGGDGQKLEREVAAIADLRDLIERKAERCRAELIELETYIQTIPDSLTRQIFVLRFEQGKSWRFIAIETRNTEENVRQICSRYVRDHP